MESNQSSPLLHHQQLAECHIYRRDRRTSQPARENPKRWCQKTGKEENPLIHIGEDKQKQGGLN